MCVSRRCRAQTALDPVTFHGIANLGSHCKTHPAVIQAVVFSPDDRLHGNMLGIGPFAFAKAKKIRPLAQALKTA